MIAPDPESERLRRLLLAGVASESLATLIEVIRSAEFRLAGDFGTARDAAWWAWSGHSPSLEMSLDRVPLYLLYKRATNAIGVSRECSSDPEDREITELLGRSLLPGSPGSLYLSLRLRPELFSGEASRLGATVRAYWGVWSDSASADPDTARRAIRDAFSAGTSAPANTLLGWLEARFLVVMNSERALSLFEPYGSPDRIPLGVLRTAAPYALILAGTNECELACLWNETGAVLEAFSRAPSSSTTRPPDTVIPREPS